MKNQGRSSVVGCRKGQSILKQTKPRKVGVLISTELQKGGRERGWRRKKNKTKGSVRFGGKVEGRNTGQLPCGRQQPHCERLRHITFLFLKKGKKLKEKNLPLT